jgi:O-antigen ligase
VWSLIGELFAYVGLLFIVSVAAFGDVDELNTLLHPISLIYLSYTLVLASLVTIRATSIPAGIAGRVWLAFCGLFTCLAFGHAAAWAESGAHMDLEDVFVLFNASALLGLVQIGLTVALPILLMRSIRPRSESTSS